METLRTSRLVLDANRYHVRLQRLRDNHSPLGLALQTSVVCDERNEIETWVRVSAVDIPIKHLQLDTAYSTTVSLLTFRFSRRPDAAWSRRRFYAFSERLEQVSHIFLEGFQRTQRFNVNGQKKVAERHGPGFARNPIHAANVVAKRPGLEGGAEQLDRGGPAVALVAAQLVAGAAHRRQKALAEDHVAQNSHRVGPFHALIVHDATLRRGLAFARVPFDLAALVDARGAVNDEGEGARRGQAEAERIGAQHGFRLRPLMVRNKGRSIKNKTIFFKICPTKYPPLFLK